MKEHPNHWYLKQRNLSAGHCTLIHGDHIQYIWKILSYIYHIVGLSYKCIVTLMDAVKFARLTTESLQITSTWTRDMEKMSPAKERIRKVPYSDKTDPP